MADVSIYAPLHALFFISKTVDWSRHASQVRQLWSADYASCFVHSALSMEEMTMTKSSKVILDLRASMSGRSLDQLSHSEVLLARETVSTCSQVAPTALTFTIAEQGTVRETQVAC